MLQETKVIKSGIPMAIWTIKDVLIVISFIFLGGMFLTILILELFGDNIIAFRLGRYLISLLTLFLPLFWVKKKYKLSREALGLKKGDNSLFKYVFISIGIAIIYSLLVEITPLRYGAAPAELKNSYSYLNLILLPLSISGFATIVLAPISEEIMDRGFIYGYLRRKIGVVPGLLLQALLFSLLHLGYLYGDAFSLITNRFLIGLILGFLYEKTGSIYPSMICHATFNYFAIIIAVLKI